MLVLRRRVGQSLNIARLGQVSGLEVTQLLSHTVMLKMFNVDPVQLGGPVIGHYPDGAIEVAARRNSWLTLPGGVFQAVSDRGQARLTFAVDNQTKIWRAELVHGKT